MLPWGTSAHLSSKGFIVELIKQTSGANGTGNDVWCCPKLWSCWVELSERWWIRDVLSVEICFVKCVHGGKRVQERGNLFVFTVNWDFHSLCMWFGKWAEADECCFLPNQTSQQTSTETFYCIWLSNLTWKAGRLRFGMSDDILKEQLNILGNVLSLHVAFLPNVSLYA